MYYSDPRNYLAVLLLISSLGLCSFAEAGHSRHSQRKRDRLEAVRVQCQADYKALGEYLANEKWSFDEEMAIQFAKSVMANMTYSTCPTEYYKDANGYNIYSSAHKVGIDCDIKESRFDKLRSLVGAINGIGNVRNPSEQYIEKIKARYLSLCNALSTDNVGFHQHAALVLEIVTKHRLEKVNLEHVHKFWIRMVYALGTTPNCK
jgi:hypothetical protein